MDVELNPPDQGLIEMPRPGWGAEDGEMYRASPSGLHAELLEY